MAVFGIKKVERRPVDGFGGRYEVGSDGSVWGKGSRLAVHNGYVNLSHKGVVQKVKVCYLVARAFLPNLEGRPYVRHKNGVGTDDRAENLEWSEKKEELRGRRAVLENVTVWRKESGELVGSWKSIKEMCVELRLDESSVRRMLRGKAKSVKGLIFKV